VDTPTPTLASEDVALWTLRGVLARHKWIALGVAVVVAVMVAMILVAVLGSKGGPVDDATTCSQWSSTNQARQLTYARLYLREHGAHLAAEPSPASVIAAINRGCNEAFGEDVSDTVTVLQAISGNF
jgi:flagellar basal body-associated protein FliL